jgi:protein involved in polysaccharide export with SLBB domain
MAAVIIIMASGATAQTSSSADSLDANWSDLHRFFDKPVDPEQYLIRPGEDLYVTFVNAQVVGLKLIVDPEGKIIHPTLGVTDLTDQTLAGARVILDEKLRQLYNVDEIVISIKQPRRIAVSVSGAVRNPGLYVGFTSQRVSELIKLAGGVQWQASTRQILFAGGQQPITVDLDKVKHLGDNSANPCLYAGYSILVPDRHRDRVQVVGEVFSPREIELVEGDDIATLIGLAGGVRSSGSLDSVQVIGSGRRLVGLNHIPQADDIIFVPNVTEYDNNEPLIIFGAVANPGPYACDSGMTIADLIARAGGLEADASHSLTTLFRRAGADAWGRVSDWRYPITGSSASDIMAMPLLPADSVYVPFYVGYVRISGEVLNPGMFPFVPGKNAMYYINAAGGFLPTADKDRIDMFNRIARSTTAISRKVQVHEGNELIVNQREELR